MYLLKGKKVLLTPKEFSILPSFKAISVKYSISCLNIRNKAF